MRRPACGGSKRIRGLASWVQLHDSTLWVHCLGYWEGPPADCKINSNMVYFAQHSSKMDPVVEWKLNAMKTVLIVDDEPILRMDLSDMLEELGFQVIGEAADGFDAIETCRVEQPDIVLMDVKMPIFDGLSAAETILKEDLAGCVVMLTAFNDPDIIQRASAAGVTGYLVKPIDQRSLLPTLEVAVAQSTRLRESRAREQEAQRRIREDRDIHKAQQLLAKSLGCSSEEAYRKMRKAAMDKRVTVAALARRLIAQAKENEEVQAAKEYLKQKKG